MSNSAQVSAKASSLVIRSAIVAANGDGKGCTASVVEGAGGGGAGGDLGDGHDAFPFERVCAADMNNVNPHPRSGNEGQPGLYGFAFTNVGIPTF